MFEESTMASSCGTVAKAKKTSRTDSKDERAANWSAEVEMIGRDDDTMLRDDETMIVLNVIDLANANAMAPKRFRATAEAHMSDETMKYQVSDSQLNDNACGTLTARKLNVNQWWRASECGKGRRAMGMECSIGIASGRSVRPANYNPNIFCSHRAERGHTTEMCWNDPKNASKPPANFRSQTGSNVDTIEVLV